MKKSIRWIDLSENEKAAIKDGRSAKEIWPEKPAPEVGDRQNTVE